MSNWKLKQTIAKLPNLMETAELNMSEIKVPIKLFNPAGGQTWYIYEADEDGMAMCFADLGDAMFAELGSVDLNELWEISIPPFGVRIEKDISWDPETTLQEVYDKTKAGMPV